MIRDTDLRSGVCVPIPHRVYFVNTSGGDSKEDPPVPMPNTEVKLLNVDDTWRVTARESRKLPEPTTTQKITVNKIAVIFRVYIYSSIAQLAERMTVNHDVAGSSPAGGATKPLKHRV